MPGARTEGLEVYRDARIGVADRGGKLDLAGAGVDGEIGRARGQAVDVGAPAVLVFDFGAGAEQRSFLRADVNRIGVEIDNLEIGPLVRVERRVLGVVSRVDLVRIAGTQARKIDGGPRSRIGCRCGELDLTVVGLDDVILRRAAVGSEPADARAPAVGIGDLIACRELLHGIDADVNSVLLEVHRRPLRVVDVNFPCCH